MSKFTKLVQAAIGGDEDAAEELGMDIEDTTETLCLRVEELEEVIRYFKEIIENHIRMIHSDGDGKIVPANYEALLAGIEGGMELYREQVAKCDKIVRAARSYVDIRSNHPQVAGEAWRDLCSAVDG